MEESALVASKPDNVVTSPTTNGSDKPDTDADADVSLDDSSSGTNRDGISDNCSKIQQQKQTNGTVGHLGKIVKDERKAIASAELINNAKHKKAAAGVELKGRIIEFMRDKPYLWNRWHPGYNDNKRREKEFSSFSHEIDYPVAEIKRVWHVLRTNFFRAHKYQAEKRLDAESSKNDRCWKYYQSMEFILESAHNHRGNDETPVNTDSLSINDDSSSSIKDIRQTRSIKALKASRSDRRTNHHHHHHHHRTSHSQSTNHNTSDSSNTSTNVPSALLIANTGAAAASSALTRTPPLVHPASDLAASSLSRTNHRRNPAAHRDDNLDTNVITNLSGNQFGLTHGRAAPALAAYNEMSRISYEADDDHLYARSMMATLKKFDPTTKEVIKLKFQEIIVEYMQKQQHQLTTHAANATP